MENNLIYDYCISNTVTIRFWTASDLDILHALFNVPKESMYLWPGGGYVSYYHEKRGNSKTTLQINPYPQTGYIVVPIELFLVLALPNKSILESI